jgi:CubicO group peptidase (beta-lactamase class C family)
MNEELALKVDNFIKEKHYRLINSVLLYQGGDLLMERYYNRFQEKSTNNIKSIWKSILSICVGICLDKGYIRSLDEPISQYIEEFNKDLHPFHKRITIRHLLTMTSGIYWNGGIHYHCPMLEQLRRSRNWLEFLADIEVSSPPGLQYQYKEWDVILLSALIGKAAGKNTFDFCNEVLYEPLGIQSGRWWESSTGVVYNIGRNELEQKTSDLTARDLAKIGLLFLGNGKYEGKVIVSRDYVKETITPSERNPGYGYLWWLFKNSYGCRGYGGQEITVVPDKELVFVVQATATDSGKSYDDVFGFVRGCID